MGISALYIMVDFDGEVVRVYPNQEHEMTERAFAAKRVEGETACGSVAEAKRRAEVYAKKMAARFSCQWGCNY
jgi:hypothetical protein